MEYARGDYKNSVIEGRYYIQNEDQQPVEFFRSKYSTRGLSLLRPLPSNRTCESAGIPEEYCVCQKERSANISDPKVRGAAIKIIDQLNVLLSNYSKICAKLELDRIIAAQIFASSKDTNSVDSSQAINYR